MISAINHPKRIILLIIVVLCMITFGCASRDSKKGAISTAEEAYIDLKQGFSIVIPSTWQRMRIPVSSPDHRSNVVSWQITSQNKQSGLLQVITAPRMQKEQYQIFLSSHLGDFYPSNMTADSSRESENGTFHGEVDNGLGKIIFLSTEGSQRTYLVTFNIPKPEYTRLLPIISKVFSSVSILNN